MLHIIFYDNRIVMEINVQESGTNDEISKF